jgi:hypothetical protein
MAKLLNRSGGSADFSSFILTGGSLSSGAMSSSLDCGRETRGVAVFSQINTDLYPSIFGLLYKFCYEPKVEEAGGGVV